MATFSLLASKVRKLKKWDGHFSILMQGFSGLVLFRLAPQGTSSHNLLLQNLLSLPLSVLELGFEVHSELFCLLNLLLFLGLNDGFHLGDVGFHLFELLELLLLRFLTA